MQYQQQSYRPVNNQYNAYVHPHGMRQLSPSFQPSCYDVLCARGKAAYDHDGNSRFRDLVRQHQKNYEACTCKYQKSKIVSHIVNTVRSYSPHGGFVKKVNGIWHEVGDRAAKEKTGQTFRDLLHLKYSSSTKAKARVRVQKRIKEQKKRRGSKAAKTKAQEPLEDEDDKSRGKEETVVAVVPKMPKRQSPKKRSASDSSSLVADDVPSSVSVVSEGDDEVDLPALVTVQKRNPGNPHYNNAHHHHAPMPSIQKSSSSASFDLEPLPLHHHEDLEPLPLHHHEDLALPVPLNISRHQPDHHAPNNVLDDSAQSFEEAMEDLYDKMVVSV